MDKKQIVEKLTTLKVSKKLVEQLVGMSVNNLSKWMKNPDKMPDKYAAKIDAILCDIELHKLDATNVANLITSLLTVCNAQYLELQETHSLCNELTETNIKMEAQIGRLQPAADSWNQRMQATVEAIKTAPKQVLTTTLNEVSAEDMIKAIRAEKIPKERDTLMGRKSWQLEQEARIRKIQNA